MERLECGIIRDLLPLYLDEVCSPESRRAVEAHLSDCPDCRLEWERMKRGTHLQMDGEAEKMTEFQDFISGQRRDSWKKGLSAGILSAGILVLAAFYLLPLLIVDTGSGMFILLLAVPAFCFAAGVIFGLLAGFRWYFPVALGLLFLPAVYLFMNSSALVYVPIYAVIGAVGEGLGWLIRHLGRKNRK